MLLFLVILACCLTRGAAQQAVPGEEQQAEETNKHTWSFSELELCNRTSLELRQIGVDEPLTPCILVDLQPDVTTSSSNNATTTSSNNNKTKIVVVTLVMVTDQRCSNHRDGAHLAVKTFNQAGGRRIGFFGSVQLLFRFVSIVAGNSWQLSAADYNQRHQSVLESAVQTLQPHYIVGTCSPLAHNEKDIARQYQTILMAGVGPPSYYSAQRNPWLFGMHVNSDVYTVDSVRRLQFWAQQQGTVATQPVRVIYRTSSEFFYSTCQAAIDLLSEAGFENIEPILYDPVADHDDDGTPNEQDVDFLESLADQACPPPADTSTTSNHKNGTTTFNPALFLCTRSEHAVLLERLRTNQCLPVSLWLTAATWTWAYEHTDQMLYIQGGTQWHKALTYRDEYYESGAHVLEAISKQFGYPADADAVVHYSIPMLFANFLQSTYSAFDDPNPIADFANLQQREFLRRLLASYGGNTMFGPVGFDHNQRNHARGAASSQWLPLLADNKNQTAEEGDPAESSSVFRNALVSPIGQAEAAGVIPALSALPCPAGSHVNATRIQQDRALLADKCSQCPVDTYTASETTQWECSICPTGSHTNQSFGGATNCLRHEEHLLSPGLLIFAYLVMGTTLILGCAAIGWVVYYRKDAIVRLAQFEFLLLICVGAMISSSSILPLTFQAAVGEDTTMATRGCQAVPFLYTVGWSLQYGSLMSKTYRLYRVMRNELVRVQVTVLQSAWLVVTVVAIDLGLVVAWMLVNPLEYTIEITGTTLEDNVETIESVGRCRPSGELDVWVFVAPIFIHHLLLMTVTNVLLCRVRDVNDRYQEQKYMAMAGVFLLEIVVVGLPVLIAAKDSYEASFIVLVGIIGLADIGVLCLMFIPKVMYQRRGLEEGVGVGESIMRETHQKAVQRENSRRDPSQNSHCADPSGVSLDPASALSSDTSARGAKGSVDSRIPPVVIEEADEESLLTKIVGESTQVSTSDGLVSSSTAIHGANHLDDNSEEASNDPLLGTVNAEEMVA